jgi:hypothetical protein
MKWLWLTVTLVAACEWAYVHGYSAACLAFGLLALNAFCLYLRPDLPEMVMACRQRDEAIEEANSLDAPALVIDCRSMTPTHADIVEVIDGWRSLLPEIRA